MLGHAAGDSAARHQEACASVELLLPATWTLPCLGLVAVQKLSRLHPAALCAAKIREHSFAALPAGERR